MATTFFRAKGQITIPREVRLAARLEEGDPIEVEVTHEGILLRPQKVIDAHQETLEGGTESARRILKAGGRLGMGGDYGFAWNPHGDYAKELTFFVKHVGLTPLEVIRCATKTGAEIMGRGDEFGTVEAGKLADLLVVDGDVVADVSVLEDRTRFLAVMQGGVVKAGKLAAGEP